jgi:hypothetical protein
MQTILINILNIDPVIGRDEEIRRTLEGNIIEFVLRLKIIY